jgi:hypothetical protein
MLVASSNSRGRREAGLQERTVTVIEVVVPFCRDFGSASARGYSWDCTAHITLCLEAFQQFDRPCPLSYAEEDVDLHNNYSVGKVPCAPKM